MKRIVVAIALVWIVTAQLMTQIPNKEISKDDTEPGVLVKPAGIIDRAGGTHNASNIGLFFENRGKLYPRRLTQGPSGEFPINADVTIFTG